MIRLPPSFPPPGPDYHAMDHGTRHKSNKVKPSVYQSLGRLVLFARAGWLLDASKFMVALLGAGGYPVG